MDNEVVQNYAKQIDINQRKFNELNNVKNAVTRVKNFQEVEPEVQGLMERFPDFVSDIKKMAKDGYFSLTDIVADLTQKEVDAQPEEPEEEDFVLDVQDPSWYEKAKEAYDPELIKKSWKSGVAPAKDLAGGAL